MNEYIQQLRAQITDKANTINMLGEVGHDFTAAGLMEQLQNITGSIEINLYSGGGSLFEGSAIYSILNRRRAAGQQIDIFIHGLAASAGSFIAMAGTRVVMVSGSMMMVHNAWTVAAGNAGDLREQADIMELQQQSMIEAYMKRTGKDKKEIQSLLDAETWMTAQQAVDAGFADEVMDVPDSMKIAASIDRKIASRYAMANIPESVKVTDTPIPKTQKTQIMNEAILKACGLTNAATDSDVLAFITTLKAEKSNLQSQLTDAKADVTSKSDLIATLQTENTDLKTQNAALSAQTLEDQIDSEVDTVLEETGAEVADEVMQGLRRRAQRIVSEDDEEIRADLRSDMVLFAKANAIKTGAQIPNAAMPNAKGSMQMNSNAPKGAAGDYEARLKAKVDAILAQDPSQTFQQALAAAKDELRTAELNGVQPTH